MNNNKPLNKFRTKGISITIWPSKNGGYQCNVIKEYKAKDSPDWKKTNTFFPEELDSLEKMCADARRWIHEQGTQAEISPHEISKSNGYQPPQKEMFGDDDIDF